MPHPLFYVFFSQVESGMRAYQPNGKFISCIREDLSDIFIAISHCGSDPACDQMDRLDKCIGIGK